MWERDEEGALVAVKNVERMIKFVYCGLGVANERL
jgi:hypothetical protein